MKLNRQSLTIAFCCLFFIAGIGALVKANKNLILCRGNFEYLNQELKCSENYSIKKHGYADFKVTLQAFIQSKIDSGEASEIAFYFRDLENGPTLGVNEHINFASASLLKLPYLITYLKIAEDNPALLDQEIVFRIEGDDTMLKQTFIPKEPLIERRPYSIYELLRRMIIYSDNRAAQVLLGYLDQILPQSGGEDYIRETVYNLGIVSVNGSTDEFVTVKSYASIFLQLYNVAYLNREMSEKALELLVQSEFASGLVGGLPQGIKVASKFGERVYPATNEKQLHDCGIVYYPENPYLVCIMTRGDNFDSIAAIIQTISRMMYEEVESRKI